LITHFYILLLLASFGFSISLLVETSAWVLKSMSTKSNHGFFNARAGIYVYGGRFFALLFMTVLSLLVDKGSNLQSVMIFISISVSLAAIIQLLYWNSSTFFKLVNSIIIFLLLKNMPYVNPVKTQNKVDNTLFFNSWVATSILVFGVTSPYILACMMPEIRMTIATFGQVINAIGTVILLFKVEPLLYRRMDKNDLHIHVFSYMKGRCFGLMLAAGIFWLLFFKVK
jgi:Alternate to MurJ